MPDENPTLSPAEESNGNEGTILLWLTDEGQRIWSVEEVIREHGNRLQATDAIANLHGAGLIHRTSDDFVFATRAAIRGAEIDV